MTSFRRYKCSHFPRREKERKKERLWEGERFHQAMQCQHCTDFLHPRGWLRSNSHVLFWGPSSTDPAFSLILILIKLRSTLLTTWHEIFVSESSTSSLSETKYYITKFHFFHSHLKSSSFIQDLQFLYGYYGEKWNCFINKFWYTRLQNIMRINCIITLEKNYLILLFIK